MIADLFSLGDILMDCEATLRLQYDEGNQNNVNAILKAAKERLENAYQCRLDEPVYTVQAKNALVANDLEIFIKEASSCVERLSTMVVLTMFSKRPPVNLADVNFLGFTRESLTMALRYMQDRVLYSERTPLIPPIKNALNNIEMSHIKRLFIIMLAFEGLGMEEGVAACASLLYLGGVEL